jgi:hypothetical protein
MTATVRSDLQEKAMTQPKKRMGRRIATWALGAMLGATALSGSARAEEVKLLGMQKAPGYFKFQAQVSQGKLPIGDARFSKVWVSLLNGATPIATEEIPGVVVRDGVLNLEIGQTSAAKFEQAVGTFPQLQVQICIEQTTNCLKPVPIASVPYAIKSTYAYNARYAANASHATECNYTHRAAAEANSWTGSDGTGTGYFDFETPAGIAANKPIAGLTIAPKTNRAGFIQWRSASAVAGDPEEVHLCAQETDPANVNNVLRKPLTSLIVHAESAVFTGAVTVGGKATITGGAAITGETFEVGTAGVSGGTITNIYGPVNVGSAGTTNKITFNGPADVKNTFNVGTNAAGPKTTFLGPVEFKVAPLGPVSGNSVTSGAIKDGEVKAADIAAGVVAPTHLKDCTGSGKQHMLFNGTDWACSKEYPIGLSIVNKDTVANSSVNTVELKAACPTGKHIISGSCGAMPDSGNANIFGLVSSMAYHQGLALPGQPVQPDSWNCEFAKMKSATPHSPVQFRAQAYCGDIE